MAATSKRRRDGRKAPGARKKRAAPRRSARVAGGRHPRTLPAATRDALAAHVRAMAPRRPPLDDLEREKLSAMVRRLAPATPESRVERRGGRTA